MYTRVVPIAIALGASLGAGCEGTIDGGGPGAHATGDQGASQTGGGSPGAGQSTTDPRTSGPPPDTTGDQGATKAGGGPVGAGPPPDAVLDPGRVTLRRLNRTEYNNTVRDLLGTSLTPADSFPPDESSSGFDTIGATLSISPLHAERFEAAASNLAGELLSLPANDPRRTRILTCDVQTGGDPCARQILSGFARRAFRRPVEAAEVDDLIALTRTLRGQGASAVDAFAGALTAVLMSPHFIFRVELDATPGSTAPRPVSGHELATRLAYLLWSSMPDDELLAAADSGQLIESPTAYAQQLARMLASPKGSAFPDSFGAQWFSLRFLPTMAPSRKAYPAYDDSLKESAATETQLFFKALLQDDQPLPALVTAPSRGVDARLAKHYASSPRVGLLTQTSFLMVTSHPDTTSPVKRGAWVLSKLLCTSPPPPPPDVPALPAATAGDAKTQRARLEAHRSMPQCASCHSLMDPIGLGFENYDGIGSYRTLDNGQPIDAHGTLPGGQAFSGVSELVPLLAQDPRFSRCALQQMLTYGIGRPLDNSEAQSYVDALAQRAAWEGKTGWRSTLEYVVTSEAFRTTRSEPAR